MWLVVLVTACQQYVAVLRCEFSVAAEWFSRHDVVLFQHVVAQCTADSEDAIDALVAPNEPSSISDALSLLRQARLVVDG